MMPGSQMFERGILIEAAYLARGLFLDIASNEISLRYNNPEAPLLLGRLPHANKLILFEVKNTDSQAF